jgi:curli biogenesis system outer membrane secretion channel CsgG
MRPSVIPLVLIAVMVAPASAQQKRRVAVLDFDCSTVESGVKSIYGADRDIGKGIADLIVEKLVASGEYSVIERKALDKVLTEQNFSNSDRVDPNSAAKIGRVLGVDAIVIGSVTLLGRDDTRVVVGISARMVSTDTAEILAAAKGQSTSSLSKDKPIGSGGMKNPSVAAAILGEASNLAVAQLCLQLDSIRRTMPEKVVAIDGVVADVEGGVVVLNVGRLAGVRVGDRLTALRKIREVRDPTNGSLIRSIDNRVGDVIVTEVDERSATGQFRGNRPAQAGDAVRNQGQASRPLTNEELLRLANAGFDEDALIKAVEAGAGTLDLSVSSRQGLSSAGIGQKVIDAALAAKPLVLKDGTPLHLKLNRTLSSEDAHTGDRVDFEVLEEVRVDDFLVVPKGGKAIGTIAEAQAKRRMGRGGKLNVIVDYALLITGEKVAIRAVHEARGGGHTGAMIGAMAFTAELAPLFLLIQGKDITIPKGTRITAYVNGNAVIGRTKANSPGPVMPASVPQSPAEQPPQARGDSAGAAGPH